MQQSTRFWRLGAFVVRALNRKKFTMPDPNRRVALYLQDKHPLSEAIEYVRYAEASGFEAVWQAESRLVRDALVPMAAYAATTKRITGCSGGIDDWSRDAALLA